VQFPYINTGLHTLLIINKQPVGVCLYAWWVIFLFLGLSRERERWGGIEEEEEELPDWSALVASLSNLSTYLPAIHLHNLFSNIPGMPPPTCAQNDKIKINIYSLSPPRWRK
jgi:hypothetical protein